MSRTIAHFASARLASSSATICDAYRNRKNATNATIPSTTVTKSQNCAKTRRARLLNTNATMDRAYRQILFATKEMVCFILLSILLTSP